MLKQILRLHIGCLGILTLQKKVGHERLDKAVERSTHFGVYGYTPIRYILRSGL
jgi:hypothetical protein